MRGRKNSEVKQVVTKQYVSAEEKKKPSKNQSCGALELRCQGKEHKVRNGRRKEKYREK